MNAVELKLEPEDCILSGIVLDALRESELASKLRNIEDEVHEHKGVWWRRLGTGWYQPCFPLSRVDHSVSKPNPLRSVVGYTHVAADGAPSNSIYRTIMRDDVANYRFRTLPKDRRTNLRKALNSLVVKSIEDEKDLLGDGYEVYLSCHDRVRWGRDKTDRSVFQRWVGRAFRQKGFALGAYKEEKLVGFMIPHRVADTIVMSYTASHSEFLQYRTNDALYHGLLSIARQSPGVSQVDFGPLCAKQSLNLFKLDYAKVHEFQSFTWMNPLLRAILEQKFTSRYPWLSLEAA